MKSTLIFTAGVAVVVALLIGYYYATTEPRVYKYIAKEDNVICHTHVRYPSSIRCDADSCAENTLAEERAERDAKEHYAKEDCYMYEDAQAHTHLTLEEVRQRKQQRIEPK